MESHSCLGQCISLQKQQCFVKAYGRATITLNKYIHLEYRLTRKSSLFRGHDLLTTFQQRRRIIIISPSELRTPRLFIILALLTRYVGDLSGDLTR